MGEQRATPAEALERSRVDVIGLITGGIPARRFVPGADGLMPEGKRGHITAERKSGKSLSVAVVTPVYVVAAGGRVVVLDRENGGDEYARRLREVLDARGADRRFRERVRAQLSYHAWPSLSLAWGEEYPAAFAGVDLVIFDSSRSHTAPLGLKENESDDYARFTDRLIDPLMREGVATITLDNAGHVEKDRARGTSAKEDLCDVAFVMRVLSPFSSTQAGRIELRCTASRIGEITPGDTWQMALGGGHYGGWEKIGARPPEARDELREATLEVLSAAPEPLGVNRIAKAVRERPGNALRFSDGDLRTALAAWAEDPTSGVLPGPSGKGYLSRGGSARHGTHGAPRSPQLATDDLATAETRAATGDSAMADSHATARHGGHGGDGVSRRDATPATPPSENGHDELPDGWTIEQLEARAAEHAERERETAG
jgi:hypothetical protein